MSVEEVGVFSNTSKTDDGFFTESVVSAFWIKTNVLTVHTEHETLPAMLLMAVNTLPLMHHARRRWSAIIFNNEGYLLNGNVFR